MGNLFSKLKIAKKGIDATFHTIGKIFKFFLTRSWRGCRSIDIVACNYTVDIGNV